MLTTSNADAQQSSGILFDLHEIVEDLWRSRSLIAQLTLRDIRVRYKQALMGFAWAILMPLLVLGAGLVVRVALLNAAGSRFELDGVVGVMVKGLAWSFFAAATGFSTNVLTLNGGLIGKVYFPRETLPLSVLFACGFDALIAIAALTLALPFFGWQPSWALLWVPILSGELFALSLAVGFIVSCANLFFRDVKYLVQLMISFGIFFTPVFYEPHVLGGRWIPLQMTNPLSAIMEGLRLSVAHGHNLLVPLFHASDGSTIWTPAYLYYSAALTSVALVVSALIFHRAQYRFAEYL